MANKKLLGILIPTSTLTIIAFTFLVLGLHAIASPWISLHAKQIVIGSLISIIILIVVGAISISEVLGEVKKRV